MEIAVLVKPVPESETRLRPDASGTVAETEGVKFVLAGYDESAVEQALLLKEANSGSTVQAIGLGPLPRVEEVLRSALALGVDTATAVEAPPGISHDPVAVARALALAVQMGHPDLVLTGKQSQDEQSGVVPSILGEILGVPEFSPVVSLAWNPGERRFEFAVVSESGRTSIGSAGPVVIGLQEAKNDPRTAKLPMILKSRKAPIGRIGRAKVEAALAAAGDRALVRPLAFRLPAPRTGARMIEYKTPEEAAEKLVRLLGEEAKVLP